MMGSRVKVWRWILPGFLLVLSLVVYLGFIRPHGLASRAQYATLADTSRELLAFLQKNKIYPSEAIYEEMTRLEKVLIEELESMMAPPLDDKEIEEDLGVIFKRWGYSLDDPILKRLKEFENQVIRRVGRARAGFSSNLTKSLAMSLCEAGLTELENLECDILEHEAVQDPRSRLHAFGLNLRFIGGSTEALEFVEDWILNARGGFLLKPERISIERTSSTSWTGDLSGFSSPPIRVDMRVSVFSTIDKG
ncbi:MAG: hypothetical protein ACYTG7_07925 [Planctomycetota bacterium]|jgi:hypothetical protein